MIIKELTIINGKLWEKFGASLAVNESYVVCEFIVIRWIMALWKDKNMFVYVSGIARLQQMMLLFLEFSLSKALF